MAQWLPQSWRQALTRLREDIDRALERGFRRRRGGERAMQAKADDPGVMVDIDMNETDVDIIVTAELPGLDRDDFTVCVTENRLALQGVKRHDGEEGRRYQYSERSYGPFARAIALPCEIDDKKATAQYVNGLLMITLPKSMQPKAKRIDVQAQ
ncbi:MAG: Hsp20/alpha crystallin family protein [Acidobacteria bacterium]|nr:MAG: Hsp20/alpha crystallin family protein [Acidobacteriota bacterium]